MIRNIVLVTNEINPYRKSFYDRVYDYCHSIGVTFTVLLMTKVEHGYNWNYEEVKSDYAILMHGRHFTFPIVNHLNCEVVKYLKEIKPDVVVMAGSYFFLQIGWLLQKRRNCIIQYTFGARHISKRNGIMLRGN